MKKIILFNLISIFFLNFNYSSFAKLNPSQEKTYSKLANIKAKNWHKLDSKTKENFLDLYMKSLPEKELDSIITNEQFELIKKYKNNKKDYYNMKLACVVMYLNPCMRNYLAPPIEELEDLQNKGLITTIKAAANSCMNEGKKANR